MGGCDSAGVGQRQRTCEFCPIGFGARPCPLRFEQGYSQIGAVSGGCTHSIKSICLRMPLVRLFRIMPHPPSPAASRDCVWGAAGASGRQRAGSSGYPSGDRSDSEIGGTLGFLGSTLVVSFGCGPIAILSGNSMGLPCEAGDVPTSPAFFVRPPQGQAAVVSQGCGKFALPFRPICRSSPAKENACRGRCKLLRQA